MGGAGGEAELRWRRETGTALEPAQRPGGGCNWPAARSGREDEEVGEAQLRPWERRSRRSPLAPGSVRLQGNFGAVGLGKAGWHPQEDGPLPEDGVSR